MRSRGKRCESCCGTRASDAGTAQRGVATDANVTDASGAERERRPGMGWRTREAYEAEERRGLAPWAMCAGDSAGRLVEEPPHDLDEVDANDLFNGGRTFSW